MSSNISFQKFSLTAFRELAAARLGFPVSVENPYKICDFKPAFGLLFEEYLKDCNYWGYCDLDLIFGNVTGFLNKILPDYPDIISSYIGFMSGPISIFRNIPTVNKLFQDCPAYKEILQNKKHFAFDENIESLSKQMTHTTRFAHLAPYLIWCYRNKVPLNDLRYHFQWYYKFISLKPDHPRDLTEAVWSASIHGRIKASFNNILLTDPYLRRTKRKNWKISWQGGKLFDLEKHKEIMAFQFQEGKKTGKFITEEPEPDANSFTISPNGIKNE